MQELELWQYLLILITGLVAGFINTVAAGGSILTLPMMYFIGLPPNVANGTNRVAIFIQGFFSIYGFKSKGIKITRYGVLLGTLALIGAIAGALFGAKINDEQFKILLSGIMVFFLLYSIFGKKIAQHVKVNLSKPRKTLVSVLSLGIGFYGGLIQAGTGMFIIIILTSLHGLSLVRSNAIKVLIVLIYTTSALAVFIFKGLVIWEVGLIMAAGNATGGWIGSRWSVKAGNDWIRYILIVMVITMTIKLWFF